MLTYIYSIFKASDFDKLQKIVSNDKQHFYFTTIKADYNKYCDLRCNNMSGC